MNRSDNYKEITQTEINNKKELRKIIRRAAMEFSLTYDSGNGITAESMNKIYGAWLDHEQEFEDEFSRRRYPLDYNETAIWAGEYCNMFADFIMTAYENDL